MAVAERASDGAERRGALPTTPLSFPLVMEALRDAGLPVEVVGLGGLLTTPEVSDLVALLWVVQDPTRGDQLMRLLTGPVTRLGAADLDALWAWARELHSRPWRVGHSHLTQDALPIDATEGAGPAGDARPSAESWDASSDGTGAGRRDSDLAADSADTATLVEALDELPPVGWTGRGGVHLSDEGLARLHGLADVVRRLRRLTGLPLVDLLHEAETAVGLDIEVLSRPEHTASTARVHLDAFADVAARYVTSSDRPTLSGFLSWLEAARSQERGLDAGQVESDTDAVQVLTVHAAKGLEWDVVAIPSLVEGAFPTTRPRPSCRSSRPARTAPPSWSSTGAREPPRTRGGSSGSIRCPTTCEVTGTGCRASTGHPAPTARRSEPRSRSSQRTGAGTPSRRNAGWPMSP